MNKQETGDKKDNRLYNKIKKRESRARLAEKKIIVQVRTTRVPQLKCGSSSTLRVAALRARAMLPNSHHIIF